METFKSTIKEEPAVRGENTASGVGLSGVSEEGRGVEGRSTKGVGVVGVSEDYRGIEGRSTNEHAIFGRSTKGAGVAGISEDNRGVHGRSTNEHGVFGESTKGVGVAGVSENYRGVQGRSTNEHGVFGISIVGAGVVGVSEKGAGVTGESMSDRAGVVGRSEKGPGVWGESMRSDRAGVHGKGPGMAGFFEGDVTITGNLTIQGVSIQSWLQRIINLEREVAALRQQCSPGGGGTVPDQEIPKISRVTAQESGGFRVEGSGFLKSYDVKVRVTNAATFANNYFQIRSDRTGKIDGTLPVPPQRFGTVLDFSANDGRRNPSDSTGTLWSNTVRITV